MAEQNANSARKAVVIGAGVVGIATALYLQREGAHVTLVDPESPAEAGASFGNAGLIATHIVQPLATASILPKIPSMLMDELAPLAIRWRYLPTVAPWLLRLMRATTPSEVERISSALSSELRFAEEAYGPLLDDAAAPLFHRKGILVVYPDEQFLSQHEPVFDLQRRNGVAFERLGHNEVHHMVPDLSPRYRHGIHYLDAGYVSDPLRFAKALFDQFRRAGGELKVARATSFATRNGLVSGVETSGGLEPADIVVIAAGIWSKRLAAGLGSSVPLESERGYHVTLQEPGIKVDTAMMVGDIRFAVTPMNMGLRVAGTIEFAGLAAAPNPRRHEALLQNARRVFPELKSAQQSRWMGHRPSLPDSLPVVGRSPRYANAYFNFGHGHLGLTSAAVTGRAVAELAFGKTPVFDLAPFRADRFSLFS